MQVKYWFNWSFRTDFCVLHFETKCRWSLHFKHFPKIISNEITIKCGFLTPIQIFEFKTYIHNEFENEFKLNWYVWLEMAYVIIYHNNIWNVIHFQWINQILFGCCQLFKIFSRNKPNCTRHNQFILVNDPYIYTSDNIQDYQTSKWWFMFIEKLNICRMRFICGSNRAE